MNSITINDRSKADANSFMIDNYLNDFNNTKLVLPSGIIFISRPIIIKYNEVTITGTGRSIVILNTDVPEKGVICVYADRCNVTDLIIANDIDVNYIYRRNGNHMYSGVYIDGGYRTRVYNVLIYYMCIDGVTSTGTPDRKASVTLVDSCVIEYSGRNSIRHEECSQDPMIVNTFTQDAESHGLFLNGNYGSVITNSHFYRNKGNNVNVVNGGRHRFENCTLDNSRYWGVVLSGTTDIIMAKCLMFDNNTIGLMCGGLAILNGTSKCIIHNNCIYDDPPVSQSVGIYIDEKSEYNNVMFNEVRNSISNDYDIRNKNNSVLNNTNKLIV